MAVADADRALCRWGRRLFPSHEIDCEYRVDLRALCSPPFALSRYWGIGRRRSSTELQSLNFPGIYTRCTGSLPELGLFGSPAAYAAADPIDGPAEQGGISSIAARTIKLNVISTTAPASRTKPRIRIAGEEQDVGLSGEQDVGKQGQA